MFAAVLFGFAVARIGRVSFSAVSALKNQRNSRCNLCYFCSFTQCHKTPVNKKMKMDDDAENEDDDDSLSFVQKGVQFVQAMTGMKEIKSKER